MRIAQINTYTNGGAAVVAKRLHEGLLQQKVDSLLVTRYGVKGDVPHHIYFRDARVREFIRRIIISPSISPFKKQIQESLLHPNLKGRPEGFEMFSPLFRDSDPQKFDFLGDRDLLHLHWVNGFIDHESFFNNFRQKKFVWTLHDMNPFTGGCHHSDGCMKFQDDCAGCPQLQNTIDSNYSLTIQRAKKLSLDSFRNDQLTIVSPSTWLLELSRKSRIFRRFRHERIANPSFDVKIFLKPKEVARRALGLPVETKIILFASDNLNNPRKGVSLLFQALGSMKEVDNLLLIGLGHRGPSFAGINIRYPGKIRNMELLATYFNAADVFVTSSIAENSPLVVIESLTCGTPVVASDVGGIPDLINEKNGLLFPAGSVALLAAALRTALRREYNAFEISKQAISMHSIRVVAAAYEDLYASILKK